MTDPKTIYLEPWCERCEEARFAYGAMGRQWCTHDEWGRCEECGRTAVKYERITND